MQLDPRNDGVTWVTYAMIAAGLAVIYLLPRITKAVPSPLVAILLLTGITIYWNAPVIHVGDMGDLPNGLPVFGLPDIPLTWETLQIIAPYSLTMAAVGLLESLLTAQIVDDMTHTDSNKQRESWAQGVANIELLAIHGKLHERNNPYVCCVRVSGAYFTLPFFEGREHSDAARRCQQYGGTG